jgi:class 3 adenylate cyclase
MPRCAVCGQDNPGGFRFCGGCGASLAGPARAPTEERRLVTVLFCDLVGFTARSDQADPEDVGALLRPYHTRLRAEIERLGGTLDKFIGDGAMAVFGAPVAHEDDPERAVRCALGVLAAIDELNQAYPSLDLAIRIGITTGEALVRLGPDQQSEGVVGDVVNTASRLEGVAPAGGVVVGEATFRATRRLFDYQELGAVQVKGKADPVPVWRLERARSRTGIEAVRRAGTPFIGRQAELELLRSLFDQTAADRTVRLVTVVGEPGVGKSRFVSELAASVDARPGLVTWRQGRCLPYGDGITFWALGEIVKAQAGILESDPSAEAAAKLEAAVAGMLPDPSERGWLRARLAPLLGIAGPDAVKAERAELFAAWRRFVEAMAASHPLVLVVEDLHWADPAMLEFLEHLVERSARALGAAAALGPGQRRVDQDPPGRADRSGDGPPGGRPGGQVDAARRGSGPAAGAGRRQPPVRRGVRPPPHRPGPGRRGRGRGRARHPRPRHRPRADRGPPGRPHPRGQGAGPGRRRGRPGLLARRGRRHGRQPVRPRG